MVSAIEIVGPFRGVSGHDRHTRELVRHLVQQGLRVQLTPLDGWSIDLPRAMLDPAFDAHSAPVGAELALHFVMPNLCRPRAAMPNVNFTMFEADRIPADWVQRAAAHERIVVPADACRDAWIRSGVPAEKVRVAPLGVDGAFFGRDVPPLSLVLPDGRPLSSFRTRFLNIAELRPRKNHLGLLRAWMRATRRDDDAALILKLTAYNRADLELFRADVESMSRAIGRTSADAAPVLVILDFFSDEQMIALYRAATHYVSMSFGEGWDLPMMEAAAAGLALIAPAHSAYLSYLTSADAELIPSTRVPAVFEGRAGAADHIFFDGASWWRPDEEAAQEIVRRLIRGGAAKPSPRERITRDYSWSHAAARLRAVLDEIC